MGTTPGRAKGTSTTTSTGPITIADPPAGLATLTSKWGAGVSRRGLVISGPSGSNPTYFEKSVGAFDGTAKTYDRASVIEGSNGASLVNLPAGTHDVFPWWPVGAIGSRVVAGSTTVVVDDWGDVLEFTGASASTWTFPAVANLPDGWSMGVNHLGSEILTLSGSIDGGASILVFPGESFWLKKLGSEIRSIGRPRGWIPVERLTASASASLDHVKFLNATGISKWRLDFDLRPTTDDVYLLCRIGIAAGFHLSGYTYGARYQIANSADADSDSTADANAANIALTRFVGSAGNGVGNLAAEHVFGSIEFADPTVHATVAALFTYDVSYVRSDGVLIGARGHGMHNAGVGFERIQTMFHSGTMAAGYSQLSAWRP